MDGAILGGIVGTVVGLAGGAVGTYISVTNTRGPMERAFMIRAATLVWIGVTLFLTMLFLIPDAYQWLVWIVYAVALPLAILALNRKQRAIRSHEEQLGQT